MSRKRLWPPGPLGIRTQLTLWYSGIFAALILLFCVVFFITVQNLLASGVDTALQLRAQQIAAGISNENGNILILDVTGDLPELDTNPAPGVQTVCVPGVTPSNTYTNKTASNVKFGIMVRILDAKGQLCYMSPAFRELSLPAVSITQPLHEHFWRDTVTSVDGEEVRLLSIPLIDSEKIFGVLQVGESLEQLTSTLRSITFTLLFITPFVLVLGACGSYWLAKRAFRPIHLLVRTAQDIKAGDLQRRVPVPRARDEVHDLALTLNEMIARLGQAFTQQQRFMADASHELRTPVAVIRSATDIALAHAHSSQEYVAVLRDVNAEAEQMSHLIGSLLTLARADENQLQLDHEPVRLDLLAADVVASIEPLAIERGIYLQILQLEPTVVLGDTARLIQVILSLVDNALTYTNAGGSVMLGIEHVDATARLVVHDTGIGIAPEDLPHIFERFYRADQARARVVGGSGLGLAIVDWVVRAHGGSISVESQVGKGSTFMMLLPLAPSDAIDSPVASTSPSQKVNKAHLLT